MIYQVYPMYCDSGFKWFGDLPDGWKIQRLKNVLACPITDGPHTTPNFFYEGVPFLSVDGIQDGELQFQGCRFVSIEDHQLFTQKVAPKKGDILLGKAASTGKIAQVKVDLEFSIWSPLALLRPDKKQITSTFLEYALKSPAVQAQIDVLCTHNTQSNISMEDIPKLVFPVPPIFEQKTIAAFLDWKTGQIDALIAKKKELMDKLKEKRLAVITQAVTKGMNPAAPLRDSGISWLGAVPAHWEVKRLKFVAHIGNGSTPNREDAAYWDGGVYPWLNSSVVNQETVTSAEQFVTPLALAECHLPRIQPPAVLVGITGQGRTRGMASTLLFEATINQHLAYVKPDSSRAVAGFLRRVFDMAYSHLRSESENGGSTKGAITCEQIAELPVPVPPLVEQIAIAAYIDVAISKVDQMAEKTESAIARLTEYRTALITAATTGKIDVRKVSLPAHS